MDGTTAYRVKAAFQDGRWLADVPQIQGTCTWARNLAGLDRSVREAIALALDLPEAAEADLLLAWEIDTRDDEMDDGTASPDRGD